MVLPPFYMGVHAGDWQVGAAWYRCWLEQVIDRLAPPDWLRRHPAWCWTGLKEQYASVPDGAYADLPSISESFADIGFACIQVTSWLEDGHDTRYPDFVAGPSLGGEGALIEAVDKVHESGRFVSLYTNGRIFDPLSPAAGSFPEWPSWAVQAPAGRGYVEAQGQEVRGVTVDMPPQAWDPHGRCAKESYGAVNFAVMCPSAPAWQGLLVEKLTYLATNYGIDGIYIDQVLGAECVPCYADNHGHHKPNEAWIGYRKLMRQVNVHVKRARPQAYLATEGISDILGQYFDIVQSHQDWRGVAPAEAFPMPELTRHVMPWLIQAAGPIQENDFYHLRLAHVTGSGLDIACRSIDPSSVFANRLRRLADWRQRLGPVFLAAEPLYCWVEGFPDHRAIALYANHQAVIYTCDLVGTKREKLLRLAVAVPAGSWEVSMWETQDGARPRSEIVMSAATPEDPDDSLVVLTMNLPWHEIGVVVLNRVNYPRLKS